MEGSAPLSQRQWQSWAWGTALAWATGRTAVWSLVVLGWRLPAGVNQVALAMVLLSAGGLLVAALQATLLRHRGVSLIGWLPVTWLGMTLASLGPVAVFVLSTTRVATLLLLLSLLGITAGCLGQWFLLRRAGTPPEDALWTLALGWGIAAGLSAIINWAFLGALSAAGPFWRDSDLLLFLIIPFTVLELLLPGVALGFGTGQVVRETLGVSQGMVGEVSPGADGGHRRRVGLLLAVLALLAILGLVAGVLLIRGDRTGLARYESQYGVSFAYPAAWRAERSREWFVLSDPDRQFLPALVLFRVSGQAGPEPASDVVPGLIGYEEDIRFLQESRWEHRGRPIHGVEYTFYDGRGDSWFEMRRRVLLFPVADGERMGLLILQAPQELYPSYKEAFDALIASIEFEEGTSP